MKNIEELIEVKNNSIKALREIILSDFIKAIKELDIVGMCIYENMDNQFSDTIHLTITHPDINSDMRYTLIGVESVINGKYDNTYINIDAQYYNGTIENGILIYTSK